eukprot:TRINITY_DN5085_c0_g3_i2.p1 TRINITY_DN5085_c0_g3~~TRINITY_DN5085_c0_g3_i2.p1  ORF type:complete len:196 (+),score=91.79 TRINITY_DN5085_c0_g3_i2:49-636(+)
MCASGIGYYGSSINDEFNEESPPFSQTFTSRVCQNWEVEANSIKQFSPTTRVVNLRFAVVLSSFGGAFPLTTALFKMYVGGSLGEGTQFLSWVSLEDTIRAIDHICATPELEGPINIAASYITQAEYTKLLAQQLQRPTIIWIPQIILRMIFGQAVDEVLFASQKVVSKKLLDSNFRFLDINVNQLIARLITELK